MYLAFLLLMGIGQNLCLPQLLHADELYWLNPGQWVEVGQTALFRPLDRMNGPWLFSGPLYSGIPSEEKLSALQIEYRVKVWRGKTVYTRFTHFEVQATVIDQKREFKPVGFTFWMPDFVRTIELGGRYLSRWECDLGRGNDPDISERVFDGNNSNEIQAFKEELFRVVSLCKWRKKDHRFADPELYPPLSEVWPGQWNSLPEGIKKLKKNRKISAALSDWIAKQAYDFLYLYLSHPNSMPQRAWISLPARVPFLRGAKKEDFKNNSSELQRIRDSGQSSAIFLADDENLVVIENEDTTFIGSGKDPDAALENAIQDLESFIWEKSLRKILTKTQAWPVQSRDPFVATVINRAREQKTSLTAETLRWLQKNRKLFIAN